VARVKHGSGVKESPIERCNEMKTIQGRKTMQSEVLMNKFPLNTIYLDIQKVE